MTRAPVAGSALSEICGSPRKSMPAWMLTSSGLNPAGMSWAGISMGENARWKTTRYNLSRAWHSRTLPSFFTNAVSLGASEEEGDSCGQLDIIHRPIFDERYPVALRIADPQDMVAGIKPERERRVRLPIEDF